MKNFIRCINVDFESAVTEDFYGGSDLAAGIHRLTGQLQISSSRSKGSRTFEIPSGSISPWKPWMERTNTKRKVLAYRTQRKE
jgi:hypothetical protein